MQFRLKVKDETGEWWEQYNKPVVRSKRAAEQWGRDIVDWYNATRRNPTDRKRTFVEVDTKPENQKYY
jgi:hypothetical protein